MASGFTVEEKKSIVIDSLLPMLRNDLHRVVDCTCGKHGKPGPGPNFTAAMLCLVACEVIGRLCSDPTLDDDEATMEFLYRVADQTGDKRYRDTAKALITYFRHGIVHSFMPKQPSGVRGRVDWAQVAETEEGVCVDTLASPTESLTLKELRRHHLSTKQVNGQKVFIVVPQVLYVDVMKAIDSFEQAVQASDVGTMDRLEKGFEKWWGRVSSIKRQLDDAARKYLGIS